MNRQGGRECPGTISSVLPPGGERRKPPLQINSLFSFSPPGPPPPPFSLALPRKCGGSPPLRSISILNSSPPSPKDLWLRGEEVGQRDGERLPPVRRARPGTARQRHRQLCLEGHDWLPEEQVGHRRAHGNSLSSHVIFTSWPCWYTLHQCPWRRCCIMGCEQQREPPWRGVCHGSCVSGPFLES